MHLSKDPKQLIAHSLPGRVPAGLGCSMLAAAASALAARSWLLEALAAGASIVLTAVVIFAISATANEIRKSRGHDHHDHEHPHVHGEIHV